MCITPMEGGLGRQQRKLEAQSTEYSSSLQHLETFASCEQQYFFDTDTPADISVAAFTYHAAAVWPAARGCVSDET